MDRREVRLFPFVCLVAMILCWAALLPLNTQGDVPGQPEPACYSATACNHDCTGKNYGCTPGNEQWSCKTDQTNCHQCNCTNISKSGSVYCECAPPSQPAP